MKKALRFFLAALAVMLVLTGCSGGGQKEESKKLVVWATPITENFEDLFNTYVVPKFKEANPNVEVELEMLTWEGVADRLQSALTSKNYPDVYIDGTARTAKLPSLGVLVPVDDVFGSYNDWFESVKTIGVIDGVHYLTPVSTIAASRLAVNMTLAEKYGTASMLPADSLSWNIQDFYEFVKATAQAGEADGVSGTFLYAGSSTSDDILYSLILSNGGNIVDKATMKCVANTPEAVEVVDVLGKIVREGYAVPGAVTLTGGDASTPFVNRKYVLSLNMSAAAMLTGMADMVSQGYSDSVDKVINVGIPHAAGQDMVAASWGANCAAIFDNGDAAQAELAKKLVKTMLESKDLSSEIWAATPTYTPVRDLGIEYHHENADLQTAVAQMADWTGKYADSTFGILEPYWAEIRNCFYPELQAVYTGEKTAQQAMDAFVEAANKVLESYK